MSVTTTPGGPGTPPPAQPGPPAEAPEERRRFGSRGLLFALGVAVVGLSLARVISGEDVLTSTGTSAAVLSLSLPIAMAGLGGLVAERAGVVNIGLEGMMILGTWGAGWAGFQWGPWAALVAAVVGGALGGVLHAVATVTFGVDHIVSGVAINLLAVGLVRFLSEISFVGVRGGGPTQSPTISGGVPSFDVPVLASGPEASTGTSNDGTPPEIVGDCVGPPPRTPTKEISDRNRTSPAASRLIATPLTMWSTPNVTVATACRRPPSMPPTTAPTSAAHGPHW